MQKKIMSCKSLGRFIRGITPGSFKSKKTQSFVFFDQEIIPVKEKMAVDFSNDCISGKGNKLLINWL